ncbi:MAG: nickel pincer cofactor biosynthesis protein LarB [Candidatus Omnitrophica bacterium]|nr:nickel pincer cofactor biosynthesis protein LarB [Candidatus Omnitrophota bacterium]
MDIIKKIEDIARLDVYREAWAGIPEIILAEGKDSQWITKLLVEMAKRKGMAIATRVNKESVKEIKRKKIKNFRWIHYDKARMIVVVKKNYKIKKINLKVGLISAGTTDIYVAEEARRIMELLGCQVITAYDIGIAGVHRLFIPLKKMLKEKVVCIVVVAGMDGALPTLVKSLVDVPVIGVPTSSGYGYGGQGESALMTMLQSCSPGLLVVNIDNGFGAACAAVLIAKQIKKMIDSSVRSND